MICCQWLEVEAMNTRQSSKKEWTLERKNALMGYIMVSPILVGILLFTVVPVFFSLYISFTDWDMLHPQTWVGCKTTRPSSPTRCWAS